MKLYILFGQRKCTYDGQYAPEALAIADEWTMDENPKYIMSEEEKYTKSNEFSSLALIPVEVSTIEIDRRLKPDATSVKGTII